MGFLAWQRRTKKEREYLVVRGMEMHDAIRTIGSCLDPSSRCRTAALVLLLLLPPYVGGFFYATVCLNERNIYIKLRDVAWSRRTL